MQYLKKSKLTQTFIMINKIPNLSKERISTYSNTDKVSKAKLLCIVVSSFKRWILIKGWMV